MLLIHCFTVVMRFLRIQVLLKALLRKFLCHDVLMCKNPLLLQLRCLLVLGKLLLRLMRKHNLIMRREVMRKQLTKKKTKRRKVKRMKVMDKKMMKKKGMMMRKMVKKMMKMGSSNNLLDFQLKKFLLR